MTSIRVSGLSGEAQPDANCPHQSELGERRMLPEGVIDDILQQWIVLPTSVTLGDAHSRRFPPPWGQHSNQTGGYDVSQVQDETTDALFSFNSLAEKKDWGDSIMKNSQWLHANQWSQQIQSLTLQQQIEKRKCVQLYTNIGIVSSGVWLCNENWTGHNSYQTLWTIEEREVSDWGCQTLDPLPAGSVDHY